MLISDRANSIAASPTLRIAAKAKQMQAEGIDVIDFSVGEPDFPTPQAIKAAGIKAIESNFTKYTANEGIPDLKKAIIERLKEDHGLTYTPGEIIVSCGAKHSLYNLMQAVLNEGEEVIIPTPYWVSYPEMVFLAKGKPVLVEAKEENGFKLTPSQLKAAISANTKALMLNNPSNPTGAVYSRSELEALAEVAVKENILVVADEIYEKLVYDNFKFVSFASLNPEIKKRTVIVNGVSKAYSMTGWRIGYAAGPIEIIAAMGKIQSHSTSNASSVAQKACVEAFGGPQHEVSRMAAEFQRRRNYVLNRLQSIPNINCAKPDGAFYVFPNICAYYGKEFENTVIRNSYGMAYYLLRHANVAIVPGDAFGAPDNMRISYATSMENLEKGMSRIIEAFQKLKTPKKVKKIYLSNFKTKVRKSAPVDTRVNPERRDALAAEAQAHLAHDNYYEWNANVNGIILQLRTNITHLYDFWMENWYPAELESDIEPHGILYAVDGVTGREPHGFYCSETKTGLLFNSDHYGSLRSMALGLVTDVGERLFDVHAIRGMSLEVEGTGVVFVGPAGTKKTEIVFGLLNNPGVLFHSGDYLLVRYGGGFAAADNPERKVYIPTNAVESFSPLANLFDRSRCENVITKKDDCKDAACLRGEDCRLDRGSPYCYKASKEAHALLDPYWLGGMRKHVKRIDIRYVFLLKNDPLGMPVERVDPEEAVRQLELGQNYGSGAVKNQPFYNPHWLTDTSDRAELQKKFWRRLLKSAKVYQLNSGAMEVEQAQEKVLEIASKGV
jgi:aspartate/methionine/tyrosine aminotransferase